MPIHTEPIAEVNLQTSDSVVRWIQDTQASLERVPLRGLLENGAIFRDDEYLGDGDVLLHFNQRGFAALCQRLGFKTAQLSSLETPSLASHVLNDLLAQQEMRVKLSDDECVVDSRTGTIIGLVSSTYVTYSNSEFFEDITRFLEALPDDQRLEFHEAYGVNTELTMRFTLTKDHGTIEGRGGQGSDRSKVGLEFRNTMVGNSSVRINYFVHRLVCANGLMVPAAGAVNRIFHSGRRDTFDQRLERSFREVLRNVGKIQDLLNTLGALDFDPTSLARVRAVSDSVFEIIPGSKQVISTNENLFLRYPADTSTEERERLRRDHDAQIIGLIPKHFGGELSRKVFASYFRDKASLFDFVNVFTEHAKSKAPAQKLEIEERAGALAKYIADNARKLAN